MTHLATRQTFDFEAFAQVTALSIRMLDNVLDLTVWPLEAQQKEAQNKRRVGLGFTGLGDALIMMKLKYNSEQGRAMASKITEAMRDATYNASVDLAIEKAPFPLFDADKYLAEPHCASRLRSHQSAHPYSRHSQFTPVVNRAHWHNFTGVCRQCLQWH